MSKGNLSNRDAILRLSCLFLGNLSSFFRQSRCYEKVIRKIAYPMGLDHSAPFFYTAVIFTGKRKGEYGY